MMSLYYNVCQILSAIGTHFLYKLKNAVFFSLRVKLNYPRESRFMLCYYFFKRSHDKCLRLNLSPDKNLYEILKICLSENKI